MVHEEATGVITADGNHLKLIGERIRTQDNRCTDAPMFLVQKKVRDFGYSNTHSDEYVWMNTGCECEIASARDSARLDELDERDCVPDGWEKVWYRDRWEFVTACFTEQGCRDFIAADGHNHRELRIYADGSYRNAEFRAVRDYLKSL